jgi:hypothetical protein
VRSPLDALSEGCIVSLTRHGWKKQQRRRGNT